MTQKADYLWFVRLFEGPVIEDGRGTEIRHFRSQRVGALLAYLAMRVGRRCAREELYEALWPGEEPSVAANRFRVTLASLRKQIEPVGVHFGAVVDVSEPGVVRMRPEAVWCDVAAVEQALDRANISLARSFASGTLLPGFYDEWILEARSRYELLLDETENACSQPQDPGREVSDAVEEPFANGGPRARLPLYLTKLIGRDSDRRHLSSLLQASRLVTLTGPGGVGKTRLAVECAREYGLPATFVSLAEIEDPGAVPHAILQASIIGASGGSDALSQAASVFAAAGPHLLLLDNAEHLVSVISDIVIQLLETADNLRILITSRQRMDIPGEVVLAVQPLSVPDGAAEQLAEFPAAALFINRARNSRPDFTLSDRHAPALVKICRQLEGMPLALELAAAHVSSQTPTQIADALSLSVIDLSTRQRGVPARHRSLRAAVQGSYELLSADLRQMFIALAVFHGGWTAQAAGIVTRCARPETMLYELATRSLIVANEDAVTGAMRYSMLDTLRQFARELLAQHPGRNEAIGADTGPTPGRELALRHARYFLSLAQRCAPLISSSCQFEAISELAREGANILAALQWAADTQQYALARAMALSMEAFWSIRGHFSEGRRWFEWLRTVPAESSADEANAVFGCGKFALKQNEYLYAGRCLNQALTLFESIGDQRGIMRCMQALGDLDRLTEEQVRALERYRAVLSLCDKVGTEIDRANCHHGIGVACIYNADFAEGRANLEIALEIRTRLSHPLDVARTRNLLAFATFQLQDDEAARTLFTSSLQPFLQHGDRWYYASSLAGLASICYVHNELSEALAHLDVGLPIMLDLGSTESAAVMLHMQTITHLKLGNILQADRAAAECMKITRQVQTMQSVCYALEGCAGVFVSRGSAQLAAQIIASADDTRRTISITRSRSSIAYREWLEEKLRTTRCEAPALTIEAAIEAARAELIRLNM